MPPIPSPNPKTENKSTFISRCMGDKVMNEEYKDQKQRAALCYSQWERKKAKADACVELKDDEIIYYTEEEI